MFKLIRIVILLMILLSVATTVLLQRDITRNWSGTLDIKIIPVISDQADSTLSFVKRLKATDFADIERYLIHQAKSYNRNLRNGLYIQLAEPIDGAPPQAPLPNSSALQIAIWSLKLRWWAWRNKPDDYHDSQIRLYILYQSPAEGAFVNHSTGLQNGLIGLIQARANNKERSLHNVIISHELLHILGASDKYNLTNGQPTYPHGYADPSRPIRHPQKYAEIMGRSIAITNSRHKVARRLNQTLIGSTTAREIGWIE